MTPEEYKKQIDMLGQMITSVKGIAADKSKIHIYSDVLHFSFEDRIKRNVCNAIARTLEQERFTLINQRRHHNPPF